MHFIQEVNMNSLDAHTIIYLALLFVSIGSSAVLIKRNVNLLMDEKDIIHNRIEDLEKEIIKIKDIERMSDTELFSTFSTKNELDTRLDLILSKLEDIKELVDVKTSRSN